MSRPPRVPPLGAHLPARGGVSRIFRWAADWDCTAVQFFTKSPSQWSAPELSAEEVARFRQSWASDRCIPLVVHNTYLINLASPQPNTLARSRAAFLDELQRAELLGAHFLVTHCGAHLGSGEEQGLATLIESLRRAVEQTPGFEAKILLENAAGQGTSLGYRFEHLAAVLAALEDIADRLGVCFDTCHAFAAGYDLRSRKACHVTLTELDDRIGLQRIAVVHLNDSQRELGSRVDRHAHIGEGALGLTIFRLLLRDPRLHHAAFIIETPEMEEKGLENLERLRRLLKG